MRPYYRRYSFGAFYTEEYMMQAIRVMSAELSSRSDLQPQWKRELRKMAEYIRPTSAEISEQKRISHE